ncbi:hypothetical protein HanRHA438_Chr08g0361761 [Helianthus annuus]|nr:hypothetical protein HanRHA438_Chr08g0361761 [Helianthus annuus]KAJ0902494.1 putative organ specific protein [Helianthus annuus]
MRPAFVYSLVFSLLLIASLYDARIHRKDFWKSLRKDEPKPKTIQEAPSHDSFGSNKIENTKDQFARDFDRQPNLKMFTKDFNPKKDQFAIDFDRQPNLKMFTKDFNPKKDQFARDFDRQPNLKMFTTDFNPNPKREAPPLIKN